jgi:hypothetical protein
MVWVFGVLFKGYFVYGCELELGKTIEKIIDLRFVI